MQIFIKFGKISEKQSQLAVLRILLIFLFLKFSRSRFYKRKIWSNLVENRFDRNFPFKKSGPSKF